ncbi:hypothetical protein Tsp_09950 [Trichinella spiralis]|uniref:Uncharacterized protein n=1 Tax=Trichinella spiralis TaxID=6334 RepID=E5SXU4_TRISP|nr:hypothetical protein Tsp_09950 [Trichinella spiralis]KRY42548.1 hypothetical protein T01_1113 [Trichinella spiralis]
MKCQISQTLRFRERFDRPMVAVRELFLRLINLFVNKNKLSTICDEFHKKVYAAHAEGSKTRQPGDELKRNSPESEPRGSVAFLHAAVKQSCRICQKQHMRQQCPSLRRASPRHRLEIARRARLCFVCLEPWHYA